MLVKSLRVGVCLQPSRLTSALKWSLQNSVDTPLVLEDCDGIFQLCDRTSTENWWLRMFSGLWIFEAIRRSSSLESPVFPLSLSRYSLMKSKLPFPEVQMSEMLGMLRGLFCVEELFTANSSEIGLKEISISCSLPSSVIIGFPFNTE